MKAFEDSRELVDDEKKEVLLEHSHNLSNLFFYHPLLVVVQALPHLTLFLYNLHEQL